MTISDYSFWYLPQIYWKFWKKIIYLTKSIYLKTCQRFISIRWSVKIENIGPPYLIPPRYIVQARHTVIFTLDLGPVRKCAILADSFGDFSIMGQYFEWPNASQRELNLSEHCKKDVLACFFYVCFIFFLRTHNLRVCGRICTLCVNTTYYLVMGKISFFFAFQIWSDNPLYSIYW